MTEAAVAADESTLRVRRRPHRKSPLASEVGAGGETIPQKQTEEDEQMDEDDDDTINSDEDEGDLRTKHLSATSSATYMASFMPDTSKLTSEAIVNGMGDIMYKQFPWWWEEEPISEYGDLPEHRRHGGHSTGFRCHQTADSLFSTSSGFSNYRGILNLCILLLVLSSTRMALENVIKYGILIDMSILMKACLHDRYNWPCLCLCLFSNFFIIICYLLELLLNKRTVSETVGHWLHVINLSATILFPAAVILVVVPSPVFSSIALSINTSLFLKLISYKQVNLWCRLFQESENTTTSSPGNCVTSEDSMKIYRQMSTPTIEFKEKKCKSAISYPDNLTLRDMYYFSVVPTLCYQLNFPRSTRIRKRFLLKRCTEMIFLWGLMIGLVQQWIVPIVNNSVVPFKELNYIHMMERLLKLAIPNHLIWLTFFYWMFHSCLNVLAELTMFGDRVFYRDWWNAETVQYFWKNWNIPVHKWASRHLYKPMLFYGFTKFQANVAVFVLSAFFHEYLVSVPLNMFRLWSFMGLVGQVPFAMFVGRYLHGKMGNMAVWASLIIGQPMAILMYYHDYYVINWAANYANATDTPTSIGI